MTVIMRISHGPKGVRIGQGPMLIRDAIELRSPVDGSLHTSKAGYYRHLKETGHTIDDRRTDREIRARPDYDTRDLKADIGRALANPMPETPAEPVPELD